MNDDTAFLVPYEIVAPPKLKSKSVHHSSNSNEWSTPQDFFDRLNAEFSFTLDPCCTADNRMCEKYFTQAEDGLSKSWVNERVFMNPPYGRSIPKWMCKAHLESRNGALVVCLVPSRTDTRWWHNYAAKGEVRFVKGRLRFSNSYSNAPFPCAVVIFRPTHQESRAPSSSTSLKESELQSNTCTNNLSADHPQ